ncbi:hypothetical protein VUR80DRAFT_6644 [Thermomyces stellatus]
MPCSKLDCRVSAIDVLAFLSSLSNHPPPLFCLQGRTKQLGLGQKEGWTRTHGGKLGRSRRHGGLCLLVPDLRRCAARENLFFFPGARGLPRDDPTRMQVAVTWGGPAGASTSTRRTPACKALELPTGKKSSHKTSSVSLKGFWGYFIAVGICIRGLVFGVFMYTD